MNYTSEDLSKTKKKLTVTLDEAELTAAKTHAVKILSKEVSVQGFRKGNVPAAVAEKNIDPMKLANETLEFAVNRALGEAVEKDDIRVLDRPSIDVTKFEPFTSAEFEAEMEVLPEIKLGDYKKLKAKSEPVKIEQSEIDEVMERMQQGFAEKKDVTRAAKKDDEVIIDFAGKDDEGEAIEGAQGNDYTLKLGSDTFIPGFEEQLIGHKADETFDITVKFPSDYHAEHLRDADVTFTITMKKVQAVTLPKIDDEFAKKAGPFESAKDLKDDVKRELTAQKERSAADVFKDALLSELAEKSEVPLADILVQDQLEALERDMMQNLMYRGVTLEQYVETEGFKDVDEWKEKELTPAAKRRVTSGLILSELSKVEDLKVTKEELEAALAQKKAEAPKMAAEMETPEARRDLANRVLTEKTMQRLIELNAKK